MKKYKIISNKHGVHYVLLDNTDFKLIKELGGKWGVCKMRDVFYVQKRFPNNKVKQLHRFLLNAPNGTYVDHINGNTLDNRRQNLRICTNSANLRNGRIRTNNISGFTGVGFNKNRNKWEARIKVKYKQINLGRFDSKQMAIKARKKAEQKYWNI